MNYTKVTFKDGVKINLYEDLSFEIIEGSNWSPDFNYHSIMAESVAEFVTEEKRKEHKEWIINNINKRLGGILSA